MSNKGLTGSLARVETASNALERAKQRRDAVIVTALDSGYSVRRVMKAAGLRSISAVVLARKRASTTVPKMEH